MLPKFFQHKSILLFLAIVFIAISFFIDKGTHSSSQLYSTAEVIEKKLQEKGERLHALSSVYMSESIHDGYWPYQQETSINWNQIYKEEGLAIFLYENDTLVFWSVNDIPVPSTLADSTFSDPIVQFKNGWYTVSLERPKSTLTLIKLILIKQEYAYENKYLTNQFHTSYGIRDRLHIYKNPTSTSVPVYAPEQEYLFSIEYLPSSPYAGHRPIASTLFFLAFFCFVQFIWLVLKESIVPRFSIGIALATFIIVLVAIRYAMQLYQFPGILYHSPLFDPSIYADADSPFLSSLGDFLLNTLLFLFVAYLFYHYYDLMNLSLRLKKKSVKWIFAILLVHLLTLFIFFSTYLSKSLVINSTLSLNPTNIINFSFFSIIALLIIGLLALSVFLVTDKIIYVLTKLLTTKLQLLLLFSTLAFWLFTKEHHFFRIICIFFIFCSIAYIRISKYNQYTFARGLFLLILFSVLFSRILFVINNHKEKEQRLYLAQQLIIERDYHAEYLLNDVKNLIQKDSLITRMIQQPEENATLLQDYIKQTYFGQNWKRYDARVTACHAIDTLMIQPENIQKGCLDFFLEAANAFGTETSTPNLFFMNNGRGRVSYLAIIPYETGESNRLHLFIEIDSKFEPEGLGYPELLLDFETKVRIDHSDYSYARYLHDTLTNNSGKYAYDLLLPSWTLIDEPHNYISHNGYNHLIFKLPDSSIILLSKQENTLLNFITYFSYILLVFSLLLSLLLLVFYIPTIGRHYILDLKSRVQISMSVVLILSLFLLGGGAIIYIKRIYNNRNIEVLKEKVNSVLIELEHKMGTQSNISNEQRDLLSYYMENFSNVFFSDINLYDLKGNVLASSRPQIFTEGLMGNQMNPEAFREIAINHKNLFIHEEHIGSMHYLSAYVPFVNYNNKPVAYLNLPYFAKQTEIQNEVVSFVVAAINSFVLLIVFSIVVALFIANRLTRPLSILQEKMKAVHLGKSNEFIEWQREDEIGKLVNAYNRMISELAMSAELLAKSERESAWKEMARQVAHEIKNPLTPMKLSVQQLQRAWNDKAADLDERIKKFTATMIEQIDTLSSIATAFSNFAKMPLANLSSIDLLKIIENTATLYKSEKNIEISISNQTNSLPLVFADKDQLSRVFSNLIKNALQAIEENKKGTIDIRIYVENNQYVVAITDNGNGISEEKQSRIFEPNFTTKSGGTGLGLAMSKSIVESFNGKIHFTSTPGKGTTFFVILPPYSPEK